MSDKRVESKKFSTGAAPEQKEQEAKKQQENKTADKSIWQRIKGGVKAAGEYTGAAAKGFAGYYADKYKGTAGFKDAFNRTYGIFDEGAQIADEAVFDKIKAPIKEWGASVSQKVDDGDYLNLSMGERLWGGVEGVGRFADGLFSYKGTVGLAIVGATAGYALEVAPAALTTNVGTAGMAVGGGMTIKGGIDLATADTKEEAQNAGEGIANGAMTAACFKGIKKAGLAKAAKVSNLQATGTAGQISAFKGQTIDLQRVGQNLWGVPNELAVADGVPLNPAELQRVLMDSNAVQARGLQPRRLVDVKSKPLETSSRTAESGTKATTETTKVEQPKTETPAEEVKTESPKAEQSAMSKAEEIADLEKRLAAEKAKFMETHKDNLPSRQERYNQVLEDARIDYGCTFRNIELEARCRAAYPEDYLEYLWEKSPKSRELKLQIALKKMSPEELEKFDKAVKRLDERNLTYDKYELVRDKIGRALMSEISEGFAYGDRNGYVAGSNFAYKVNSPLRRGAKVNDLIRVVLDEGFKDVAPTTNESTFYRQVCGGKADGSADFINNIIKAKVGDTFTDKGYSYATTSEECATSCNGIQDEGETPLVYLKIRTPFGSKLSWNTSANQREVLFPRNAEFRVVEPAKKISQDTTIMKSDGSTFTIPGDMEMTVEYVLPEEKYGMKMPDDPNLARFAERIASLPEMNVGRYNEALYLLRKKLFSEDAAQNAQAVDKVMQWMDVLPNKWMFVKAAVYHVEEGASLEEFKELVARNEEILQELEDEF